MTDNTEIDQTRIMAGWKRNALIVLALLFAIFSAGMLAGFTGAAMDHGFKPKTFLFIAAGLALLGGCVWGAWKLHKDRPHEPMSPRIAKSNRVWVISSLVGGVIGMVLSISMLGSGEGNDTIFGNGPMPAFAAAFASAAWLIAIPLLGRTWHANIDEHEMQSNHVGALAGIYTYFIITPCWWLGWRGGFLPQQQPMITFIIVLAVYCAVWLWRRSR